MVFGKLFGSSTAAASSSVNVVITGANKGIGLELCRQLLAAAASSTTKDDKQDEDNTKTTLPFPKVDTLFALCRKSSDELTQLAAQYASSNNENKLVIVPGLDLLKEGTYDGGDAVTKALQTHTNTPIPIHFLIHNAGGYGPPENFDSVSGFFQSQSLAEITPERMLYAYQLNAMAPLFLTKALKANLQAAADANGVAVKVIVVTSLMGSLSDNTSGGVYAYRASKAAVNMVGKSLAYDLPKWLGHDETKKTDDTTPKAQIAVGLVHPGAVATDFVPASAKEDPDKPLSYQKPVDQSVRGVWEAILVHTTPEATGKFWHGNYGEGVKECEW